MCSTHLCHNRFLFDDVSGNPSAPLNSTLCHNQIEHKFPVTSNVARPCMRPSQNRNGSATIMDAALERDAPDTVESRLPGTST